MYICAINLGWRDEVRSQNQKSEVRSQNQKSESESEVRNQKSP